MKHLRNFGFGKKDLEVVIEREAASLVEHILANSGGEMEMEMFTFAVPVLNVLWDMVAGHAFKREDKKLKRILDLMNWVFVSKVFVIAMVAESSAAGGFEVHARCEFHGEQLTMMGMDLMSAGSDVRRTQNLS